MPETNQLATASISGGAATDFLLNMLLGGAKINWPGDKAKLKVAIAAAGDWLKTVTDFTADLDDYAIDRLLELLNVFVDSHKEAPIAPPGPLVVGAHEVEFTASDSANFLAGFNASDIPEISRQKVMDNPKVLKALKKLTAKQQVKVLNNQGLLDLLIEWGPVILKLVMLLIFIL